MKLLPNAELPLFLWDTQMVMQEDFRTKAMY